MDPSHQFVPPAPSLHEPSAADVTRIAERLLREAAVPLVPGVPATPAMPATPPAVPSLAAIPAGPALPPLPSALPSAPAAMYRPAGDPSSAPGVAGGQDGIAAFVRQIRGLDHRALPAVVPPSPLDGVAAGHAVRPPAAVPLSGLLDVEAVRADFPILQERINGQPLAWFDNAATTQKPQAVIDAVARFYAHDNSNIHRGAHTLAARATDAYESARRTIADFLGASSPDEIIFVRGCTEGINLVAASLAPGLSRGDEIVLTELEHHANIVPWQMVAERTGAVIRVVPIDDRGDVILEAYAKLLSPLTKVVSLSHASNSLGTILPVELMTGMAKAVGARVLVDGAQSVAHFPVDMRRIGCDFHVFSGHKIFGPTGIGAVYMTREAQAALPPWQGGGNMIRDVTFARTVYADPPAKFEAGTPNIADAIGLAAALDYVTALGRERLAAYEHDLLHHATQRLAAIDGLRLVGTAREKVGVLSFVIDGLDPVEIGRALDREGIAVRAGHHCAQPSLRHFGLEATVRPSLAFYNTTAEIDRLAAAVARIAAARPTPAAGRLTPGRS